MYRIRRAFKGTESINIFKKAESGIVNPIYKRANESILACSPYIYIYKEIQMNNGVLYVSKIRMRSREEAGMYVVEEESIQSIQFGGIRLQIYKKKGYYERW